MPCAVPQVVAAAGRRRVRAVRFRASDRECRLRCLRFLTASRATRSNSSAKIWANARAAGCTSSATRLSSAQGNPRAELVFVGEGPGHDEDMQGLPFVGRAGKLLTQMIEAMGLQREDVYICNVVKCRPPENRKPEDDEVATCSPYLFRQLDVIAPKAIVCLGGDRRAGAAENEGSDFAIPRQLVRLSATRS